MSQTISDSSKKRSVRSHSIVRTTPSPKKKTLDVSGQPVLIPLSGGRGGKDRKV